MNTKYQDWITANVTSLAGFCHSYAKQMCDTFPELRLVRGYYCDLARGGHHGHWWCETETGEVVDPTRDQFLCRGQGIYEEYDAEIHGELPNGRCMNCGEDCYGKWHGVCSEECEAIMIRETESMIQEMAS